MAAHIQPSDGTVLKEALLHGSTVFTILIQVVRKQANTTTETALSWT